MRDPGGTKPGCIPVTMARVFRSHEGRTPGDYLQQLRVTARPALPVAGSEIILFATIPGPASCGYSPIKAIFITRVISEKFTGEIHRHSFDENASGPRLPWPLETQPSNEKQRLRP